MKFAVPFLLAAAGVLAVGAASAQNFPNRPIRLIVPNSPGAVQDIIARVMSPEMSKTLGQPIVVENRSGAGQIVGYEAVTREPADGHNIAFSVVSQLAVLPVITKELRFDPLKDLPPVMGIGNTKYVLFTSAKQPWKNFKEMIAQVKAAPDKFTYGVSSPLARVVTGTLVRVEGLNMRQIPYNSAGPYIQAVMVGDVGIGMAGESSVTGLGEQVRVLAVSGDTRSAVYKDAPTFKEIGHPDIAGVDFALNIRSGTPRVILDRLYDAGSKSLQTPAVRAALAKAQVEIVDQNPEAAAKNLAQQGAFFAEQGKRMGIKPE